MKKDNNIQSFIEFQKLKFGKCLYPISECFEDPINAHSVQNAVVFDLLQTSNHLVQIKTRIQSGDLVLSFENVGRNQASTFRGLCSFHDEALFKLIDTKPVDLLNLEQLFLIAYRSLLKEYHAVVSEALRSQHAYQDSVEKGKVIGNDISEAGMLSVQRLALAYGLELYKNSIDKALRLRNFSFLKHKCMVLENQAPSIACSQLFSVDMIPFKNDVLKMMVNIFPITQDKTLVIFSSTSEEFPLAESYVSRCFEGDMGYRKYELSKLVIRNSENFFISPTIYSRWSNTKKERILDLFRKNITAHVDDDSVDYYLFGTN